MERKLSDAALQGNVLELINILREDPLILHRCTTLQTKSPLHISADLGYLEFSQELLRQSPQLVELLDSHRSSPLHSAASRGHIEIVKSLILVDPDMCFARDEEGRNPVHVAAIKGHVVVLGELVQAMPRAAKERAGNEGSILHLCVKYNKLECLKMLLNYVGDSELLNCKDCEGNTVLHLAVADKQIEMLKFLLSKKYWMDRNSKNSNGLTPMDTFHQSRKDPKHKAVHQVLRRANLRESSELLVDESWNKHLIWLEDHRSSLMLVASLIAQMAFEAGLNPPGGLYQDQDKDEDKHKEGYAIAAYDHARKSQFNSYLAFCSVSLFASLSIILMLVSGLPCRKIMVYVSMATMWIAIVPMPLVYLESISIYTPSKNSPDREIELFNGLFIINGNSVASTISSIGVLVWVFLLLLILVMHIINFIIKILRGLCRLIKKAWRCCCSRY